MTTNQQQAFELLWPSLEGKAKELLECAIAEVIDSVPRPQHPIDQCPHCAIVSNVGGLGPNGLPAMLVLAMGSHAVDRLCGVFASNPKAHAIDLVEDPPHLKTAGDA